MSKDYRTKDYDDDDGKRKRIQSRSNEDVIDFVVKFLLRNFSVSTLILSLISFALKNYRLVY